MRLNVPGSTPPETVKNMEPLIPAKKLDKAKAADLYLKRFIPIASAAISPSLIAAKALPALDLTKFLTPNHVKIQSVRLIKYMISFLSIK